jgi:hypothetical protein
MIHSKGSDDSDLLQYKHKILNIKMISSGAIVKLNLKMCISRTRSERVGIRTRMSEIGRVRIGKEPSLRISEINIGSD